MAQWLGALSALEGNNTSGDSQSSVIPAPGNPTPAKKTANEYFLLFRWLSPFYAFISPFITALGVTLPGQGKVLFTV